MIKSKALIRSNIYTRLKSRVQNKWERRFLNYIRKPTNEFGFMVLSIHKRYSNLPVYVCVNDGGLWINLGCKKIILFQTNKSDTTDFNRMLPMSIENEPEILVKNKKIDLTHSEISQIKNFVIECQEQLIQISTGEIDTLEFFEILKEKGFIRKNE